MRVRTKTLAREMEKKWNTEIFRGYDLKMWVMKERQVSQDAISLSEISTLWSTWRETNPSSAIKSFIYFVAADMPLLLILLQDQHSPFPSNSARMSWFQNHHHLSEFVPLACTHSFIICSCQGLCHRLGIQRYAEYVSDAHGQ